MSNEEFESRNRSVSGAVEADAMRGAGGAGGEGDCPTPSTRLPCGTVSEIARFWMKGDEEEPAVLAPDHPLMTRFQQTLETYLRRQCEKCTDELRELDEAVRRATLAREDAGTQLYTLQQAVVEQQRALTRCHQQLETVGAKRQAAEEGVEAARVKRCEAAQHLAWHEAHECSLRSSLHKVVGEERQFTLWAEELRGQVTVSQRIAEKDASQLRSMAEGKRRQDAFLYKLTAEVANLRDQLSDAGGKLDVKQRERDAAGQAAADARADLEALQAEQRRLSGAWRGVVALLQRRDRALNGVMKERAALEEQLLILRRDADGYRAGARAEMDSGEVATAALTRLEADRDSRQRAATAAATRRDDLQRRLADAAVLVHNTEAELADVRMIGLQFERTGNAAKRELDRLLDKKRELEAESLDALSEQLRSDKAAQHMKRLATELRDRTREQALRLVEAEHSTAGIELAAARTRGALARGAALLAELRAEDDAAAQALETARAELERINKTIAKRTSAVVLLADRLDGLVAKMGGEELNPLEARVVALTADFREREAQVARTQAFWLRQQSHAVTLAQQRSDQLARLDSLRKQVMVLDQKNVRIDREVSRLDGASARVSRTLEQLLGRLSAANGELATKRGAHMQADRDALLASDAFAVQLQAAEEAAAQLQAEVETLEAERDERLAQLLEAQHAQLAWEKKLRVANTALQHIRAERSSDSETAAMRAEIHRMEVRRGQLARAQERLLQDLEQSVSRRANIADAAEARLGAAEARGATGPGSDHAPSRNVLRQRIADLRNRTMRLRREAVALESTLADAQRRRAELLAEARARREEAAQALHAAQETAEAIVARRALRGRRLERLVRLQRRARWLGEARAGRYRPLQRQPNALETDTGRQRNRSDALLSVADALMSDFPELDAPLQRLYGAMQIP